MRIEGLRFREDSLAALTTWNMANPYLMVHQHEGRTVWSSGFAGSSSGGAIEIKEEATTEEKYDSDADRNRRPREQLVDTYNGVNRDVAERMDEESQAAAKRVVGQRRDQVRQWLALAIGVQLMLGPSRSPRTPAAASPGASSAGQDAVRTRGGSRGAVPANLAAHISWHRPRSGGATHRRLETSSACLRSDRLKRLLILPMIS